MHVKVHPVNEDSPKPPTVTPMTLTWENINVCVKQQRTCFRSSGDQLPVKPILRAVNGYVKPGTLLAVIGASGSGKTTLLNTLTGRSSSQTLSTTGSIRVNGAEIGTHIRTISAFVQQNDMFLPTLTVREHLTFRAMVHMDKHLNKSQRLARVDAVLEELGLTKCADSLIGDPATEKGISGGQMRRLSFASEILTNPPLLFCDEPTSGLDTFMAGTIVQTLKTEARMGRTVLCTIHQPSSDLFAMFDSVLIMAQGRVAFMGLVSDALTFYKNLGSPCPVNYNPSDFFVHTTAIVPGNEADSRTKVEMTCDRFATSEHGLKIISEIQSATAKQRTSTIQDDILDDTRFESSWLSQFAELVSRSWKTTYRDRLVLRITILQTIFLALFTGLSYLRLDVDQKGVMDINGALFLITLAFSMTSAYPALNVFPPEVPVFLRDYMTDLYRVDTYFLSKVVVELPVHTTMPLVYSAIAYWMVGFHETFQAFAIFCAVLLLVDNVSVSFGYIVSAVSPSSIIAIAIAAPVFIILMLFGGFFLNNASVPVYLIWLEYLSWFKYANELVTVNQWRDVTSISCPDSAPSSECLYQNGEAVLDYLHYDEDNLQTDWIVLSFMVVGFRIVAFIVLFARARLSIR